MRTLPDVLSGDCALLGGLSSSSRASAFFLPVPEGLVPGVGAKKAPGIDDDPQPEWPNPFFRGHNRSLMAKSIDNVFGFLDTEDEEPWRAGPADLGEFSRMVRR
ncbi:unnamed protein product, partial [Prorocentrum cordatum]